MTKPSASVQLAALAGLFGMVIPCGTFGTCVYRNGFIYITSNHLNETEWMNGVFWCSMMTGVSLGCVLASAKAIRFRRGDRDPSFGPNKIVERVAGLVGLLMMAAAVGVFVIGIGILIGDIANGYLAFFLWVVGLLIASHGLAGFDK